MAKKMYIGAPKTEVVNSTNLAQWFTFSDPDGISSWNGNTITITGTYESERVKFTALQDMTISFDYTTDDFSSISLAGQYICEDGDSGTYTGTIKAGKYFYFSIGSTTHEQTGTFSNITCTTATSVAREVKKMYVGDEGVARQVGKGYMGVEGVARKFYEGGTPIGELAVGTTVKMNINGTAYDFIVAHQGKPSSKYDNSCEGTWLLMNKSYVKMAYNGSGNSYSSSDIHTYLNADFLSLLDSNIQTSIKQVKIPYHTGGTSGSVKTGANGLSTKVFLLSGYEIGLTTSDNSHIPTDGTCLSYFDGATDSKRITYYKGSASSWVLRSPYTGHASRILNIDADGGFNWGGNGNSNGVRPALILPSTALVSDGVVIG